MKYMEGIVNKSMINEKGNDIQSSFTSCTFCHVFLCLWSDRHTESSKL